MSLAGWTVAHRRSLLFLIGVAAVAGVFASLRLPASLFPTVDFPRVALAIDAGDMPAEQMEVQVTRPIEQAIRRVPGLVGVRSTTSRGAAEISVNFAWGTDMASATLQVNAAAQAVQSRLPPNTSITTRRMDPTVFPVLAYSLTSDTVSPTKLRELADYRIAPLLSGVAGVSRAEASGGDVQEFQALIDPLRLQAWGLALDDVARAVAAANVVTAVGKLQDRHALLLVLDDASLHGLDDVRRVVVARSANGVVRLADVADVRQGTVPRWTRVTADGHDAVLFSVYQQPGGNTVRIAADVKAKLAQLEPQLPPGIRIANWYDQSDLITSSAASVRDAILIGAVLAGAVLLLFLRRLRVTLVAVAVVPAVLAMTVLVLQAAGMGFDVMTLGGMAAAVGLVIDDAIVMVEHIARRLAEATDADRPLGARVATAAVEFLRPLAGSSAATLVIFAPLAFLSGVTGAFFKALSITMAGALFLSFVVTAVGVPLLAGLCLRASDAEAEVDGRLLAWCKTRYGRLMARTLARPWLALVALLPLVAAGGFAFTQVGSGFMPHVDEGGFVLDYRTKPGSALDETDRVVREVERIVQATPDVATYSRRTGVGLGGTLNEANQGDFFIRLKAGDRHPVDAVMSDIAARIEAQVPGIQVETAQLMEDLIGDLTAVPQPVEIKIFDDDAARLASTARRVAAALAKVPGVTGVKDGVNPAGDALSIQVDRTRAALEGIDPAVVSKAIGDALSGQVATQFLSGVRTVGVRVVTPPEQRRTVEDVLAMPIRAPDGHVLPLSRVASAQVQKGQPEIAKENLQRMVSVTARLDGRDLGSVMQDVGTMLAQPGLVPPEATVALGGLYEQQRIAFRGLTVVFASAAVLVFLLLLFLYESFAKAAAILLTALAAVSAVFVGLWLTGIELNITAMMGMTMIIGIVTEVGIFYFSEQEALAPHRSLRGSLRAAGRNRLRPIAMTTLAAILTLLPLAFAIGQGSAMQQPLAVAIVSGLIVQLPLVLVVMPNLYLLLSGVSASRTVTRNLRDVDLANENS